MTDPVTDIDALPSGSRRERSTEILRLALPLMAKHCKSLEPGAYTLWFEYIAGGPRTALRAAVDAAVARTPMLNDAAVADLLRRHGRHPALALVAAAAPAASAATSAHADAATHSGAQLLSIGETTLVGLGGILDGLMQHAEAVRGDTSGYGRALEGAMASFGPDSPTTCDVLADTVGELLEHTNRMHARLLEMNIMLSQSQLEATRLRDEAEAARREALVDQLTGLANRRCFDLKLAEAMASPDLGQIALLLIDLDHFKSINDRFGHPFGDRVLRAMGSAIPRLLPENLVAARIGGEEFAVLVQASQIDERVCMAMATRVRQGIAMSRIRRTGALEESVTASVGVGMWAGRAEEALAFIARVDKALYASKTAGRNCATYAPALQAKPGTRRRVDESTPALAAGH